MNFAKEEVLGLILILIFYIISIPLTIYWLIQYKLVASTKHKCITSRHFNTTWGYLICCVYSSNIGHPLSIILYYLHTNVSTSTIVYSYLLSDISTFLMFYLSLTRCYMIMWDKKYNLALKEQFWTTKIVNDELETYNEFENQSLTDNISKFIKYRSTLGNVKYVSIFMCCIATPITIFIIISPFIINFYDHNNINIKLSSIFRFVCTIPIVSTIVFIYFNIPKYNEYIALKFETRAIVQIICGTFLASNLLISFLLYSLTDVVRPRFLMLINGNIQIIASFLLFYVSTGFILPKLRKIILADLSFRPHGQNIPNSRKNRLHLVFTSSDHKPNKNNINSLPIPGQWNTDPSVSAEKKLRKTISIWRRRKDMKLTENTDTTTTKTKSTPNNELNNDIIINSEAKYKYDGSTISPPMSYDKTVNHTILSSNDCIDFSVFDGLPPQYENKMPSAFSETFTTNNRKGTFSKNTVTSTINPTGHIQHTHIDTITSATGITSGTTQQSYYMLSLLEQSNKSPKTRTEDQDKRFEIIHTPIGGVENINDINDGFGEILDTNLEEVVLNEGNDVSDDGIYDDTNVVNEEAMNKGYSHSKQMSATHIFTSTTGLHSSAAIITPQISKTDSKPHSRRTSGVFNALELLNINISNTNKSNNSNHSNKSSKNYTNNSTPIGSNNIDNSTPPLTTGSNSKRRRASLSVKDAYAGIKQMLGGYRRENISDPEEKIYFKITLVDPLHIVLSDQEGLSHFADHLCAEFSIENLLFIVEALQYRYCIPIYLFDNNINNINDIESENINKEDKDIINKSESCELLMHIINQNKKLPISKLLKQHKQFCILQNENIKHSPDISIRSSINNIDFMDNNNNNQDNSDTTHTRIRRKSQIGRNKQEKCCKKCIVEKFKYIIEKYVETTSINLPSAIQLKLINIWKELQISEPENRFIDKFRKRKKSNTKDNIDSKKESDIKIDNPKQNNHSHSDENSKSKSKSKSGIIILKNLKRHTSLSIRSHKTTTGSRRNSVYNEEEISKIEEEEEEKKTQTIINNNHSNISNSCNNEHTKELIHSHSVSPRDKPSIIDVNTHTDFPINNPKNNSTHTSNNSTSHISTNTSITNDNTPTEMDDEEPLPASPTNVHIQQQKIGTEIDKSQLKIVKQDEKIMENINDITDGMVPTNSMQELKGNGILTPTDSVCVDNYNEQKENGNGNGNVNENENEKENYIEKTIEHDGFGNINYITVFDEAILEIMKLIKSDTWGRFKRRKQFVDWANNFKLS